MKRSRGNLHKRIHDHDSEQCKMRAAGTAHLTEIMDDYELLPVNNYKYGNHKDIDNISSHEYQALQPGTADELLVRMLTGMRKGCRPLPARPVLEERSCRRRTRIWRQLPDLKTNVGVFDPHWTIEANFYADHYGLDTISLGTTMAWACECYELGLINKENTNSLELTFGNKKDLMELIHRMAEGKDSFAVATGWGIEAAREYCAKNYGADLETMKRSAWYARVL